MKPEQAGIFREYDLRGVYGKELDDGFAYRLGLAYAPFYRFDQGREPSCVVIGHDARLSSPALAAALKSGLVDGGMEVLDAGPCPTPVLYNALFTSRCDGGIMVTGSHNPPEYNGFKVAVDEETIFGERILRLRESFEGVAPAGEPGSEEPLDANEAYIADVAGRFGHLTRLPRLRIAVDCGNGSAGPIVEKLLSRLGCEVEFLYPEPDGNFPNHHPDPTVPANLQALIAAVKEGGLDFGIGYDGDADRIGLVDDQGGIIWGDKLMILCGREILKEHPGAVFVGEVKCSQVMYDELERLGGRPIMWKTGHSLIKSKMKEVGAFLGGEMSGHFFFADRYYGYDDAIYASCRVIELLKKERLTDPAIALSRLLGDLPKTYYTPEIRVDCPDKVKVHIVARLAAEYEADRMGLAIRDIITVDGIRVVYEDGWALLRASNTQPALVLRFEALTEARMEQLRDELMGRVNAAIAAG